MTPSPTFSPIAGCCERCRAEIETVNVEAFELTGQVLCEDCADEAFLKADDEASSDWLGAAAVLAAVLLIGRPVLMMAGAL